MVTFVASVFFSMFLFFTYEKQSFEAKTASDNVLICEQDCNFVELKEGVISYGKDGEQYVYLIPEGQKVNVNIQRYIAADWWPEYMTKWLLITPFVSIIMHFICYFAFFEIDID